MEQPNYVLRTYERVLMPKKMPKGKRIALDILKKLFLFVIIGLIVCSVIFGENMFAEMGFSGIVAIVFVAGVLVKNGGHEDVPSPIELQFFDEYLIIYRPKLYLSKRVTRKDIAQFYYKDITKCVYYEKLQRLHIYGGGTFTWYNYRKDGTLPETPTDVRNPEEGIDIISTRCAPDVDFKKEIEEHSPIKVIIDKDRNF